MKKETWRVDYPDEQTMKTQIREIVAKGVKKPTSFPAHLNEMYKQLGFRYLFHDATDVLFVFFIGLSVLGLGWFYTADQLYSINQLYSLLFVSSPLLYLLMAVFFLVRASERRTFEVEMTCKYHVFQLAAFRMLVFGLGAIVCNGAVVVILSLVYESLHVLEALCMSMSSLSLFATSFLYVSQKVRKKWGSYGFIGAWLLINVTAAVYSIEVYLVILRHIPIYGYVIVFALCTYAYFLRLKKMMSYQQVKGVL
ncbi:hypothetical protein [Metabacillus iocasae]|uniref:Uncharacterized protein n=1 Tax=Priestia iocasae TaxID=2291674 RepID=A0ABS2QUC2_9BACI|nr:hypothetical protein [Metabacillus iocasae]MBM7702798.1 hypothetical protein [Metabacillus iocasae]